MSSLWDWPGSRWWRVDLHAHSPESHDWKADRDVVRWLEAAHDAKLDAVAVTDHNTASGIALIQNACSQVTDPPIVFPGLELTVGGVHLLLILGPERTQQHVEDLLSKAEISVKERDGRDEARSPLSVEQALDRLGSDATLIIAPHVNGPKGLFEHDGRQRIGELRHPNLAAVEVEPPLSPDDARWLDGLPEIGRDISQLYGSDSHSFEDAGRRFTWIKMTKPDLSGLRLALLDGENSLRPAVKAEPGDPNEHAHNVIESIKISYAKYMGMAEPFEVKLNPWLNAVIGGRGTGKSTIVDLCRLVLRREDDLRSGSDETSLRTALAKRMRVPQNRTDEGLLTDQTLIELIYRKDGERFLLTWDQRGHAFAISRLDASGPIPEDGDIRERFPVRIYSQKELFDLARNPDALLTLIDDAIHASQLRQKRMESENEYLSHCAEARSLRAHAAELPKLRAAFGDLRRKLELLQQGNHAQILNEYRLRRRHDGTWISLQTGISDQISTIEQMMDTLVVADLDESGGMENDPAFAALSHAHEQAKDAVQELRVDLADAFIKMKKKLAAVTSGSDIKIWQTALATLEQRYKEVTTELTQAGISDGDNDLLQRATECEQHIQALEKKELSAKQHDQAALHALGAYRDARKELTERRKRFSKSASNGLIRMEIHGCAQRDDTEESLGEILGIGERHRASIRSRIAPIPERLTERPADWSYKELDAVTDQLRSLHTDPQKQWLPQDKRFETAIRKLQPERFDRLALYAPEDSVEVEFRNPKDKAQQWRPLSQGSPGQQTAALLAFVLGCGAGEPIILDQPEDDLDNALIYDLLVQRLSEIKQTRQVIVVTHNPNIVVHGDAEYIISLDTKNGNTSIACDGGLQEQKVRNEICRVMEGGRKAFEDRYRRIMQTGVST